MARVLASCPVQREENGSIEKMIRTPRRRRLVVMGLDNPIHIVFIVMILLLVFGAKRLPEIGRSLGSGMREFKDSVSGNQPDQQQSTLTPAAQQPQAPSHSPPRCRRPWLRHRTPAQAAPRLRSSHSLSTRLKHRGGTPAHRSRRCAGHASTCVTRFSRVCSIGPGLHRFEGGAWDLLDLFQVCVVPAGIGRAGDVPGRAVVGDDQAVAL